MHNYPNIEDQEQRRAASLVALSDAELDQVSGGQPRPGDSRPQPLLPGAEVQFPTGARIVALPTGARIVLLPTGAPIVLLPTGTILEVTDAL